jgi:hypothetical protein
VHTAYGAESSEHWKEEPDSLAENVNVAPVLVVDPLGPESIVVWGGVLSIVQLREAGDASTLPA